MSAVFTENHKDDLFSLSDSLLRSSNQSVKSSETRLSKRRTCTAPVIFKYYDPEDFNQKNTFETGTARLCNYSLGGMCIELKQPLKPFLPVYIRVEGGNRIPDLGQKHGHHAEVIWCRRPRLEEDRRVFHVGIQFYESPLNNLRRRKY